MTKLFKVGYLQGIEIECFREKEALDRLLYVYRALYLLEGYSRMMKKELRAVRDAMTPNNPPLQETTHKYGYPQAGV
jgi:phage terminase large subunit GpA-like protein